jgi:hypothetical protein
VTDPTPLVAARRTPWYRGPLLAIPILGVVLLGVIVAIPLTVAAVSAAPNLHPRAVTAPTSAKTGAPGTNSCWDGSSKVKGCPELTGLAGLRWIFLDLDTAHPATCSKDTRDFQPAGSIEVYACYWSDLPHTVAYLARYDGVEASQQDWSDYMKTNYGAVTGRMQLDGQDAGISIEGSTSDSSGTTTSQEDVIGYDLLPRHLHRLLGRRHPRRAELDPEQAARTAFLGRDQRGSRHGEVSAQRRRERLACGSRLS